MTNLQDRLNKLGKVLVVLSIVLCGIVVGIGFLRLRLNEQPLTPKAIKDLIKVGVSLAVSVIPEGLVAVTTVTMALGVQVCLILSSLYLNIILRREWLVEMPW